MPWPTSSRHSRGYGTDWDHRRKRILKRDDNLCQQCMHEGRIVVGNHVDHIQPKAKGGTDEDTNLQTLCKDHHDAKTAIENGAKPRVEIGVDGWPVQVGGG